MVGSVTGQAHFASGNGRDGVRPLFPRGGAAPQPGAVTHRPAAVAATAGQTPPPVPLARSGAGRCV
ncbi:hypothetical protein GCM10011512_15650 [Tersicoccus solisilvae]|uniref:Uncharacterized protein n=1 Tax=Tersicoccus solisilvae TaxID=1882339 RepID=A0ABQ1P3D4_9MICC|nr:hypothetical protein GCM10011512_15650 [Tersicoccus solisilvae]